MRSRGYECLYLPSPLLTKEGNRKDKKQRKATTLDSSIKDVEDDGGGGKTKEERHWIPSLTGSPIKKVGDKRRE